MRTKVAVISASYGRITSSNAVSAPDTHNRRAYSSQLFDFDAEFRSPLESYSAIPSAFYTKLLRRGYDISLISGRACLVVRQLA
jgi:hypothetical protein